MMRLRVRGWAALVAALTLAADQGTKVLVQQQLAPCSLPAHLTACDRLDLGGPLVLVHAANAGSIGGAAQGLGVWLLLAAVGLLLIPAYGYVVRDAGWTAAVGLGLQAGGAVGNLADRLRLGGVVDFLAVGTYVINLADIALVVGMALAIAALRHSGLFTPRRSPQLVPADLLEQLVVVRERHPDTGCARGHGFLVLPDRLPPAWPGGVDCQALLRWLSSHCPASGAAPPEDTSVGHSSHGTTEEGAYRPRRVAHERAPRPRRLPSVT